MSVEDRIEKVARQRREERAKAVPDLVRLRQLDAKSAELYAEKRLRDARRVHGDPKKIARRARVEQELEKLMSE